MNNNSELPKKDSELRTLNAELNRLRAELESRKAEMDDERRAMMFMLEDTNGSVEEMEKAQAKLREEMEVTSHLLMIAEASARTTDVDKLMEQVVSCGHEIAQCDVSVALEQARLYKESVDRGMELSHKIEMIQVMHEIDRSILSTLDPQEIIETVVRMVGRVVPCDGTAVLLVDREREGFSYAAGFGLPYVTEDVFIPFKETMAAEVMATGRTQYVANLKELVETLHATSLPSLEEGLLKEGFLSHIRLPLTVKEEVVGVLTIEARRAAAFTPSDLSTIEKVAYQIGVALQNARQLKDLEELFIGTVKSLSTTIDAKSPWTAGHSERVTKYALDIGREMGLSERELKDLELAGLLHDVGKIGTYEAILDKADRLMPEEQAMMRRRVSKSAEILLPIKQLKEVIPGIKAHHEFYDGTGYPDGLKGKDIPLFGRILAVADTVDAMAADRPYRKGKPMDVIVAELKRCTGTQFDPEVVEAFLKVIGEKEKFKMAAS